MQPGVFARALLRQRGLMRAQWLAPERLRALQWRRLQRLIGHAHAHSPFYRARFATLGLTPADIRDPADFARLPVTTREDLRAPDDLIADGFERARLFSSITSGSTGQRTTTYFDTHAWLLGKHLLKLRARQACGVRLGDRIALFQEGDPGNGAPRLFGRLCTFTVHRPPAEILEAVLRFAPTVLYGFPGHLLRLGLAAGGRLRPRLVFTSSELLDPGTRKRLGEVFGAIVLDIYGCTEVKEVAWQCPEAGGYHVNADWILVEMVAEGRAGAAKAGRIVVTPLFNHAMPLLRYDVGDRGQLADRLCPCGRGLPLLCPTFGRDVDYFRLADGSEITPYDMTCAIEQVPGMLRYQIVQRAVDRVEVRVMANHEFGEPSRAAIRCALKPVLHGLEPEVRLVPDFEHEPSGKFRIVKSELARPAEAGSAGP